VIGAPGTSQLKSAIAGLIGFAATEEQALLAATPADGPGTSMNWAAVPVVAHNTEFKAQQVHRLLAITRGRAPDEFAEVDHTSQHLYAGYATQPAGRVAAAHPTGHLADYYLAHAQPDRAVALAAHGLATASYLRVPAEARGMAAYNVACAQARAGELDEAAASVREAVALNPGLRAKVGTEPDLAALRKDG
jgi:hypothetical protein